VVNNKLKDTIKYEPLSAEKKREKATAEVKDLITDSFRRFKKRKKMDWFRFI
jgi:carboxyl-terminal processing protease